MDAHAHDVKERSGRQGIPGGPSVVGLDRRLQLLVLALPR
jgi:hypothetical protein